MGSAAQDIGSDARAVQVCSDRGDRARGGQSNRRFTYGGKGHWQEGSFDYMERRSIVATKSSSNQAADALDIRERILPVLRRHGIKRAGMFGSFVRGEATPESDVDILVELDGQASLFDFIGIKLELEEVLERRVDLVQYAAIKPLLRDRILSEEVPLL